MNSVEWLCSPWVLVVQCMAPAMCSGDHGLDSCRGLRVFALSHALFMLNNSSFTFKYRVQHSPSSLNCKFYRVCTVILHDEALTGWLNSLFSLKDGKLSNSLEPHLSISKHSASVYYDMITYKMASWHNSRELMPDPKFCPRIFVYGCLVPWNLDNGMYLINWASWRGAVIYKTEQSAWLFWELYA